jgi:parallel beta-helix repeat protein
MKKRTSCTVLALILINTLMLTPNAAWAGVFVPRLEANYTTSGNVPAGPFAILHQDFDNETPGLVPMGWAYNPSYGNFTVDHSTDSLGSGNSAKFVDNSTTGSPGAHTYFLQQKGVFTVTFSLLLVNNTGINTGLEVRVDDGSSAGANIIFGDHVIQYRDHYGVPTTLRSSYVPNRWYKIRMLLNVPGGVYSIFIDDHLEARDAGLTGGNPSQISRIIIDETMSGNPGSLMPVGNIDDIEVRRCIIVPSDYPTIQEGINVAGPGDVVFVTKQQRYFESLVINKGNLTLVGEDPKTTIIDGRFYHATPNRISVSDCSFVSISGFTITLSPADGSQVKVVNCNNVVISNNIIVSGLGNGIEISGSNDTVAGNTIQSNLGCGIRISGQYHSISSNTIDSNDECGIHFDCKNSNITDNVIQSSLGEGINITSGTDNVVVNNTIRTNKIGLSCGGDTYRITVYQNRFVGNTVQALDNGHDNKWDNGYAYKPTEEKGGGNYWSDYNSSLDVYSGPGQNEQTCCHYPSPDGISDQPYSITSNGVDHYPLYPIQNVSQYPKPGNIDYTTDVFVTATVLHLVNILTVTINVNNGSSIATVIMQKSSDDNWTGTILHKPYGTQVNYTISVQAESASQLNSTYYPQSGPYFVDDFTPPTFPANSIAWVPSGPDSNEIITVYANVTEPATASQVGKVLLSYPVGNSTWWTQMNKVADYNSTTSNTSMFTATFPRQPGNATLNFGITAFDRAGNSASESTSTFIRQVAQLSIQYNNGTLADDPCILDFGTMARKKQSSITFKISNVGQDTLGWNITIVGGVNWLSLDQTSSNTGAGLTTTVKVTADTTSLTQPTLYAGEMSIIANGTVTHWAVVLTLTIRYIIIDQSWTSVEASNRVNVNALESVAFHAEWAGNCSDATGGTVTINVPPSTGTTNSTNSTGWAVFTPVSSPPYAAQVTFSVRGVSFGGITDFTQTAPSPTIIWDRVNITLSIADPWIDDGSYANVTWKGVHESDNSNFVGQVFLNDTTEHNKVGRGALNVSSIMDSQYPSLTGFDSNTVSCIWDRIEIIAAGVSDSQVEVNQIATVWFIAIYRYQNTVFKGSNGTLYVNNESLVWNPDTEVWARNFRYDTPGTRTFSVTAVDDETHGLTKIKDDVGPQNITWGPQPSWWQKWLDITSNPSATNDQTGSTSASGQTTQAQDTNTTPQAQPSQSQTTINAYPWQILAIILIAGAGVVSTLLVLAKSGKKRSQNAYRK